MSSVGHHSSNSTSFNNNFAKGQMFPGYPQRVPNIDHSHQGMVSFLSFFVQTNNLEDVFDIGF